MINNILERHLKALLAENTVSSESSLNLNQNLVKHIYFKNVSNLSNILVHFLESLVQKNKS